MAAAAGKKESTSLSLVVEVYGHGEAQVVPLPKLELSQASDPRGFQEVVAESENFKKRTEVAERHYDTLSE